jgi:hypothetical protein
LPLLRCPQSPLAPHDPLLQPPALRALGALLGGAKPHLSEVAASILARCCATPDEVGKQRQLAFAAAALGTPGAAQRSAVLP